MLHAVKDEKDGIVELKLLLVFAMSAAFLQFTVILLDPLFASWLPLYHGAKLIFFAWLVAPQTNGALNLYNTRLEPIVEKTAFEMEQVYRRFIRSLRRRPFRTRF